MGNRTFESGLLIARNDKTDALEGYTVVVYEQSSRGGLTFVQEVDASQKFARSLLKNYSAWAVNRAAEIQQEVSAHVTLEERRHYEFDVVIDVRCAAGDARTIVARREDDPLEKVLDNVKKRIAAELADHRREEIDDDFIGVARRVTDKLVPQLERHAGRFGIALLDMHVRRVRPERYVKRDLDRDESDAKHVAALRVLDQEHVLEKRKLENKLNLLPLQHDVAITEGEREEHAALRRVKIESITTALKAAVASVENFDDLDHAARVVQSLVGRFGSSPRLPGTSTGEQQPQLTAAPQSESAPLRRLLDHALDKVDQLSCRLEDKRQVYSHFLRLVSEALLDSPDHAAVEACREALSTTLYQARPKIPDIEVRSWNELTSLDRLREQLKTS